MKKIILGSALFFTVSAQAMTPPDALTMGGISFDVMSTRMAYNNKLRIVPHGLELPNQDASTEVDGTIVNQQVADLDNNGWPELYIFTQSVGSGSYGNVIAYAVNNGKSMTPVYMPELRQKGYMGHDIFAVHEDHITRSFPLYKESDSNASPSGGRMTIRYELIKGEASWQLQPVSSSQSD